MLLSLFLCMENLGTENHGFARGIGTSVGGWGREGEQENLNKDSWTPAFLPYCPPASPPASQQVVGSDYTPLPCPSTTLAGAGWLRSLQQCMVTLGIYFSKNQAVLRGWALIRSSIVSFWEKSTNQTLFGSLFPPPPWQLDNSLSWWNFLPQDIPATELLRPFKTRASRAQKLKQPSGLISSVHFPVVLICCCGSYVWIWSLVKVVYLYGSSL